MSDLPPPPGEPLPPPPGYGTQPPPGFGSQQPPPPGYSAAPPGYGYGPPTMPFAGFGSRLGGYLIDSIVMALFFVPVWITLVAGPKRTTSCTVDESGNLTDFGGRGNSLCEVPTGGTVALAVILGLLAFAGMLLYQARLAGGPSGQTVGMRAVGVRVVDAATGGPIGAGRAVGRFLFAGFISSALCYLGFLWNLWDDKKQTWHDKVTSAVVIRT